MLVRGTTAIALGLLAGLAVTAWRPCLAGQGTYPLGDLGGRAATVEGQPRQLRIASVHPGQPAAAAGLAAGDLIEGVDGRPFGEGYMLPLRQLGTAIDDALGRDGALKLTTVRDGRPREVTVRLPRSGRFAATYPYECPKSELIYRHACAALAAELQRGGLPGGDLTTALAVMGLMGDRSGRGLEAARPTVLRMARDYAAGPKERSVWILSYVGVMLCEHQMMSPDPVVATAIGRIADLLVKGVPRHGRYGHHINADPEDLPYDGQGLNGTTTAAVWFFASAARVGVAPSALEPAFSRAFRRIRDETNAGGGVGYAWPGDDQSCMRSGHTALACSHVVQVPAWLAAEPQRLVKYRAAVASWPTRHPDDLLEAHAVSSLGLTASTAGLAALDPKAHHALMQHWRWYFALSWQPTAGSDRELAYVGGPNNTGGDFYLNGHRDLENDGFNSIMNATVAFIFAAGQERLSFYGGMPGVPGLSTAVLADSPGLQQATAALRQRKYGEARRLASRVADRPHEAEAKGDDSAKPEDGGAQAGAGDALSVAAAFVEHVDTRHLAPELARLRRLREVGDVAGAVDGLKRYVADVRGIETFETPARGLLDELEGDGFRDAIATGRRFQQLEIRARRRSKAAVADLAAFAADHADTFYGREAARLADALRTGRDPAEASAPEPAPTAVTAEATPALAADPAPPPAEGDDPPLPTAPMTLDDLFGPGGAKPPPPAKASTDDAPR